MSRVDGSYTFTISLPERVAMLNHRVEHAVELLCHQGCQTVWGVIDALENGRSLPETAGLSTTEVNAVVSELKAIMSVYTDSCQAPR